MAKRKKTDTVQLKLRIREELRRKLEQAAKGRDASLNNEMARRLDDSFESGITERLTELLTGSPATDQLLATIGTALQIAEKCLKNNSDRGPITAAAVQKIIEANFSEKDLSDDTFPDREKLNSPDWIAHKSCLSHWHSFGFHDRENQ
jgi:hypothetical protein